MKNHFGLDNVLIRFYNIPSSASWPIVIIALIFLASCSNTLKIDTLLDTHPSAELNKKNKAGGYYLDDGPGDNPPPNLVSIPDAIPRIEPFRKSNMQPYVVLGKTYTPMTTLGSYKERGIASWYGRRYHGKKTASGEIYDMYDMTAAHTTLPLPSYARVTNIKNKKSIVVRINDRGPFLSNRLIDLSYTAAYKLDVLSGGSALVEVESILPGNSIEQITAWRSTPKLIAMKERTGVSPITEKENKKDAPDLLETSPTLKSEDGSVPASTITTMPNTNRIYLQLAAFSAYNNAGTFLARMQTELPDFVNTLGITAKDGLFKVHTGPYSNQILARQAANKISRSLSIKPIFIVL